MPLALHFRRSTTLAEGSPVHDLGSYYHAGRGGAGNFKRLTEEEAPRPLHKTTSNTSTSSQSSYFFGGRGGAGNTHPTSERAIFSFDEELERDRLFHEHHAPVYSIGRGGAGNVVPAQEISTRAHYDPDTAPRTSTSSERTFSEKSLKSPADSMWKKLTKVRSNE